MESCVFESGERAMTNIIVAIVYHSGAGHTARQAAAVRRGVDQVRGVTSLFLTSEEAQRQWDALEKSDAIIFGTPTYMGSVAAQFKAFMEASIKAYLNGAWKDKIAAGFTNSASRSGDKLNTLVTLAIFAAQHGMHWVSLGLPPGNNRSTGTEQDVNRLGFFLGAGAQSNADEGPEAAPPESDLLTAEQLGKRVAETTVQFAKGREFTVATPG